ncbi:hypothetical protein CR513_00406, partial [Mucuna pruriens]
MTKQLGRIENLQQMENIGNLPSTSTTKPLAKIERLALDKPSINPIEINKLKVYPKHRNYYPMSSLVDVQYEERGDLVQNSFLGYEISEWNLDGMSEQVILDLTCQMTMATTAYKTKGFIDQLKGWWDNLCTEHKKLTILNSVKSETNQEDVVATLIYTIIQNFIGDPNIFKHGATNQLTNLYCPTMHYGQPIGYESLTYGQLHNVIVEIGIQVCTDFKLQNKMRKENVSNKRELGTFCHQYEHYANKCRVIQKINELEDETLKKNLLNILINSEYQESFSEGLEDSEDNLELEQLEIICTSSSSKVEDDNYCLGVGICTCNDCKTINTLTKDQISVLINIIDKLEESSLKNELIKKLNELITKDENSRKEFKPMNQQVTIKDLQEEIKTLKQEIQ